MKVHVDYGRCVCRAAREGRTRLVHRYKADNMTAIVFQANPDKWTEHGTMRDYLENEDTTNIKSVKRLIVFSPYL
jgi:hypothetical protein